VHRHVIHRSLDISNSASQSTSRSVQPFLHSSRQRVPVVYNIGLPSLPFPSENCPFAWGIWTPCNTLFLGPTRFHSQTESRSVQPFLQGSRLRQTETDRQTDRPTDRPSYSVCNNRPNLRSIAMRPNNSNNNTHILNSGHRNSGNLAESSHRADKGDRQTGEAKETTYL